MATHIEKEWVSSATATSLKKHVLSRAAFLGLTVASVVTTSLDGLFGAGCAAAALICLARHKKFNITARKQISFGCVVIAHPFKFFLKTINPAASFKESKEIASIMVGHSFFEWYKELSSSRDFILREVVFRYCLPLSFTLKLIDQVALAAMGAIAAPLSILTAGRFTTLNSMAFVGLHAPCILDQLFAHTLLFLNTQALL